MQTFTNNRSIKSVFHNATDNMLACFLSSPSWTDGSFYFIFHIKYDYFLCQKPPAVPHALF